MEARRGQRCHGAGVAGGCGYWEIHLSLLQEHSVLKPLSTSAALVWEFYEKTKKSAYLRTSYLFPSKDEIEYSRGTWERTGSRERSQI